MFLSHAIKIGVGYSRNIYFFAQEDISSILGLEFVHIWSSGVWASTLIGYKL